MTLADPHEAERSAAIANSVCVCVCARAPADRFLILLESAWFDSDIKYMIKTRVQPDTSHELWNPTQTQKPCLSSRDGTDGSVRLLLSFCEFRQSQGCCDQPITASCLHCFQGMAGRDGTEEKRRRKKVNMYWLNPASWR